MSIIDTAAHNVIGYVSGKSVPFTGQRLSVVSWKTDKETGIKPESKCVSLPIVSDTEITTNMTVLLPHVRALIQNVQDKIIREILENDYKRGFITQSDVEMTAVIEYLEDSNESGRLTKQSVETWFDGNLSDTLSVALAQKLGVSDVPSDVESKKIETIVAAFRKDIAALAGGKTSYSASKATQLKKALALVPENDVIAIKFNGRLDKMMAPEVIDYANAL